MTWVLTVAITSLYDLVLWGNMPSTDELIGFHLTIALLAGGTSLVAVWVLVLLPYLALAMVASIGAGFVLAFARAAVTYGGSGEELNGLMFRAAGGAVIGLVSGIVAWSVHRWTRRHVHGGASS